MTDQLFPVAVGHEAEKATAEKNRLARVYPQWEALETLFGIPRTPTTKKLYGKIASELAQAGYGKPEILFAARLYRENWPGITFTATALLKHIDQILHDEEQSERTRSRQADRNNRLVVLPDLEAM